MWTGHQSNTRDQYTTYPPPNSYNLDVWTPALPTYMYPQKLVFKCKKALFWRKCCFCCFCCVLGVAFVVFQNLVNQEMLLAIFTFLIRRLVKKLFHFEVMFRKGGVFSILHQCRMTSLFVSACTVRWNKKFFFEIAIFSKLLIRLR